MPVIHAGGRKNFRPGRQVGCWETDAPTSSFALDDLAPRAEGSTEQQGRFLDGTLPQQFPDSSRVHVTPLDLDLGYDRHGEPEMGPELGEQSHRALSVVAEMEVVANIDFERTDGLVNVVVDETLRTDFCEFPIEGFRNDRVEPESRHGFDLLLECVE